VTARRLDADQPIGSTRTLLGADDGGLVRRTVLPGGLRVITEAMPGVRSASLGIWVGVGSRDEAPTLAGASHFLEHLLFKGTPTRSALDISEALDAVGGEMNAFTAKEYTCFHARVIDADLPLAVETVADMVTSSQLAGADVESERGVILEEIAMNDDDPDDVVHNLIASRVWGDSPLGRPIAGHPESIHTLTRTQIAGYYRRRYRADAIVVAVAGNVEHRQVVRLVRRAFGLGGFLADDSVRPRAPRRGGASAPFGLGASLVTRPTEQANLVLGLPGLRRGDDRRHAAGVLNAALGGGMSSRLFQEVRENRGLAYSVFSFASCYRDTGLLGIYAGTGEEETAELLPVVCDELLKLIDDPGADELARARAQLKASLMMALESCFAQSEELARQLLIFGRRIPQDEIIAKVDAVDEAAIRQVGRRLLGGAPTLTALGPLAHLPDLDSVRRRLS
jgi:predicted Zn-dependent peptidase